MTAAAAMWQRKVLARLVDPSRLERWKADTRYLSNGPGAYGNGTAGKPVADPGALGASGYKALFASGPGQPYGTTIGGLCVVYSGDLKYLMEGKLPNGMPVSGIEDIERWCQDLPRLDQVVDAVGPTVSDRYLCVFEDSLFAGMVGEQLGMDRDALLRIFRGVSERSATAVEAWLRYATGRDVGFTPVYTSDIDGLLDTYVQRLAEEAKSPGLAENEKSKVLLMYTYLWPELLQEAGYLKGADVLCCEPFQHFVEVVAPKRPGYSGIEGLLRENPWGEGKNRSFQAAGVVPCLSLEEEQFSRQEAMGRAATRTTGRQRLYRAAARAFASPFPLQGNPLVREAANLLFMTPSARGALFELADLGEEYKERAETGDGVVRNMAAAARTKAEFARKAADPLERLGNELETVYQRLGFWM